MLEWANQKILVNWECISRFKNVEGETEADFTICAYTLICNGHPSHKTFISVFTNSTHFHHEQH